MKKLLTFFVIFVVMTDLCSAQSQTTHVTVRAIAKDAKFIGTSMGGAKILIRNVETGAVLAEGITQGSTGDTGLLMNTPKERSTRLGTEGSARFTTSIELEEPVFVAVEAIAPYAKKQARVVSSTQLWLIPGKHIEGDGLILEVPGFVIDVLSPQTHQRLNERKVTIRANLVMMCGCPTSDGGMWDSSNYEIRAVIKRDGEKVDTVSLQYTGWTSTFEGIFSASGPGAYEALVYAYDPHTGNTGVDKTTFILN